MKTTVKLIEIVLADNIERTNLENASVRLSDSYLKAHFE